MSVSYLQNYPELLVILDYLKPVMHLVGSDPEPGQNCGDTWTFSALPSVVGVAVAVSPSQGPFPTLSYKFLVEEQL